MSSRRISTHLRRSIGPLLILAIWAVLTYGGFLSPRVLATPTAVLNRAVEFALDGTLSDALWVSFTRAMSGLGWGILIGATLAVVAGVWRLGEDIVDPTVGLLRMIPWLGLSPLFLIWFGIGEGPKIALLSYGAAATIYMNSFGGIRNIDRSYIEMAQAFDVGRYRRILTVILPGALPGFLVGLRYAVGGAWTGLAFVETINAQSGIGYLISTGQMYSQVDVIVLALVLYALLGLVFETLLRLLSGYLLRWRPTYGGE